MCLFGIYVIMDIGMCTYMTFSIFYFRKYGPAGVSCWHTYNRRTAGWMSWRRSWMSWRTLKEEWRSLQRRWRYALMTYDLLPQYIPKHNQCITTSSPNTYQYTTSVALTYWRYALMTSPPNKYQNTTSVALTCTHDLPQYIPKHNQCSLNIES